MGGISTVDIQILNTLHIVISVANACTVADDSDEESAVVRKEKKVAWGKVIQKTSSKAHEKASGSYIAWNNIQQR